MGIFTDFVQFATRNTDETISGTSVSRQEAADFGEQLGFDPSAFSGVTETGQAVEPAWVDTATTSAQAADAAAADAGNLVGDVVENIDVIVGGIVALVVIATLGRLFTINVSA